MVQIHGFYLILNVILVMLANRKGEQKSEKSGCVGDFFAFPNPLDTVWLWMFLFLNPKLAHHLLRTIIFMTPTITAKSFFIYCSSMKNFLPEPTIICLWLLSYSQCGSIQKNLHYTLHVHAHVLLLLAYCFPVPYPMCQGSMYLFVLTLLDQYYLVWHLFH